MARSGPHGILGQHVVRRNDHRPARGGPVVALTSAAPISEWRSSTKMARLLGRQRVPTPTQGSITDFLAEIIAELGADPGYPAVVAVPGLVDYERRSALWAPHLPPGWVTELAEDHLTSRLCDESASPMMPISPRSGDVLRCWEKCQ